MKRFSLVGSLLLIAGVLGVGLSVRPRAQAQAQVNVPAPVRWEYKIVHFADEPSFNRLGAEGWEMVSALGKYESMNNPASFYFKRRKP